MIKRIAKSIAWIITLVVVFFAVILGNAHWQIRQFDAPLPDAAEIEALRATAGAAIDIRVLNTATQNIPGIGAVAYPSFILRWADGRLLIVDAGMDRDGALKFGTFLQRVAGADPIVSYGSVGEQLGDDIRNVTAMVFTHLHDDHTGGLPSLCVDDARITVFRTDQQANNSNFTTSNGFDLLANNSCVTQSVVSTRSALQWLPDYPGVAIYAAGGHTPGSTVVFAMVESNLWILAGDISNDKISITENLPKPFLYSLLVTPEDRGRLQELRVWLAGLDAMDDSTVVVSHDLDALLASGIAEGFWHNKQLTRPGDSLSD